MQGSGKSSNNSQGLSDGEKRLYATAKRGGAKVNLETLDDLTFVVLKLNWRAFTRPGIYLRTGSKVNQRVSLKRCL